MKKCSVFCALLGVFCFSAFATAGEYSGYYIAPKFLYSYQRIDDASLSVDLTGIGSQSADLDSEKDSSFGGALALGYDFAPNFAVPVRMELEYAMRSQSEGSYSDAFYDGGTLIKESGDMKFDVQTVFLNAYFDIETGTAFTPYVGAGVGVAIVKADGSIKITADGDSIYDESAAETQTNFAFNLGAGIAYDFNENVCIDLGYRYSDFGKSETGDLGFGELSVEGKARVVAHEGMLGLRYMF